MKKYYYVLLAILLTAALMIPVGAAEWASKELVSVLDEFPDWEKNAEVYEFEEQHVEGATNAQKGNQSYFDYVYLKERNLGDFDYKFTVNEDGLYNIGVILMAWSKSVPRSTEFKIDDSEWIYLCYDYADEDQYSEQVITGLTMYLKKRQAHLHSVSGR